MRHAPSTNEAAFNFALAAVLRSKNRKWEINAERSRALANGAARRPDIVVEYGGGPAVVLETEFEPARTVEEDARQRMHQVLREQGKSIQHTLAVKIPGALRRAAQKTLPQKINAARFRYCAFSRGLDDVIQRYPRTGWLEGGANEIAACLEHVALSEKLVDESANVLQRGIERGAHRLLRPEVMKEQAQCMRKLARALHQEEGEQTVLMAAAIIANAIIFDRQIEGKQKIPSLEGARNKDGFIYMDELIPRWIWILNNINYWPIFKIATDLLRCFTSIEANRMLRHLFQTAGELEQYGTTLINDLSGRMFQRLIVDRKFLATYYTLPVSASLLSYLAAERLPVDWRDAEAIGQLRVCDPSCGTGTLLNALYQEMRLRFRRQGGDDARLHKRMMEHTLYAADIMPAATHLTASMLSSAHPGITFANTRIATMPYGKVRDDNISIGSLDYLQSESIQPLFSTGRETLRGTGDVTDSEFVTIPDESMDVVIMNPPFTRPTNHEGGHAKIPNPAFAGFETPQKEQRAMSKRLAQSRKKLEQPAGHGNAGLASNFLDLAHIKIKPGGVLAAVLPAAFLQGKSWENARELLASRYDEITVVSIYGVHSEFSDSPGKNTSRAFSADTGMAEILLVATKKPSAEQNGAAGEAPVLFANLAARPKHHLESFTIAQAICDVRMHKRSSNRLRVGELHFAGNYTFANLEQSGYAILANPSIAQVADVLIRRSEFKLPTIQKAAHVPVVMLGELGERGPVDRDINEESGDRGPFEILPILNQPPTFPALWNHRHDKERKLIVAPDSEAFPRRGRDDDATKMWLRAAGRLHFNRDFGTSSHSLAACLTQEPAIGGVAWPSFFLKNAKLAEAMVLWMNTTPGLLLRWWIGSRQHPGRSRITITKLPALPVLDVRKLDAKQRRKAKRIFGAFCERPLLPANEAYRDEVRQELDRAVLFDLLGLPAKEWEAPLATLRRQWCAEPSVHGGKKTRPAGEKN